MATVIVRAVRAGVAGGIHRARGEEFECDVRELALVTDDPRHGWMLLVSNPPNGRPVSGTPVSAHLLAPGTPHGDLSTLRPAVMPTPWAK